MNIDNFIPAVRVTTRTAERPPARAMIRYPVTSQHQQKLRIQIRPEQKQDVAKLLAARQAVVTGLYETGETLEDTFLELMKD